MGQLIKPLYQNRNEFEELEYAHSSDYHTAKAFWKKIEAEKYLATKDLREFIESYLEINAKLYKELEVVAQKIGEASWEERGKLPILPSLFNIGHKLRYLPQSRHKEEQLQFVNELINGLKPESNLRKCIEKYKKLMEEDTELTIPRSELRKKVIARYEKLEEKIDRIHELLEKE